MNLQEELISAQAELSTVDAQISAMAHGVVPADPQDQNAMFPTPGDLWRAKLAALHVRRVDLLAQVSDCQTGIALGHS